MGNITQIPHPIISEILFGLSYSEIGNLVLTCKRFVYLLHDTNFWTNKILNETDDYHVVRDTNKDFKRHTWLDRDAKDMRKEYLKLVSFHTKDFIPGMEQVIKNDDCLERLIRKGDLEAAKIFTLKFSTRPSNLAYRIVYLTTKYKRFDFLVFLETVCTLPLLRCIDKFSLTKGVVRSGDLESSTRLIQELFDLYGDEIADSDDEILSEGDVGTDNDSGEYDDNDDSGDDNDQGVEYGSMIRSIVEICIKAVKSGNLDVFKFCYLSHDKIMRRARAFVRNNSRDTYDLNSTLYAYNKENVYSSLLNEAARCGHEDICSCILKLAKDEIVSGLKNVYDSGLRGSASGGHFNLFKQLCLLGASNFEHCLIYACVGQHVSIIDELFKQPCLFQGESGKWWPPQSIMSYICEYGFSEPVKLLINGLKCIDMLTPTVFAIGIWSCIQKYHKKLLRFVINEAKLVFEPNIILDIYSEYLNRIKQYAHFTNSCFELFLSIAKHDGLKM